GVRGGLVEFGVEVPKQPGDLGGIAGRGPAHDWPIGVVLLARRHLGQANTLRRHITRVAPAEHPRIDGGTSQMFVFKAAVLGGGTMGGEIAQVIATADIPVVVKDVDQKFVDAALEKSRAVTKSQLDRLVSKEKMTQEAADARLDEVMGLITGTTTYDGFGDVDFVIEAVPDRKEITKSV